MFPDWEYVFHWRAVSYLSLPLLPNMLQIVCRYLKLVSYSIIFESDYFLAQRTCIGIFDFDTSSASMRKVSVCTSRTFLFLFISETVSSFIHHIVRRQNNSKLRMKCKTTTTKNTSSIKGITAVKKTPKLLCQKESQCIHQL